MNKYKGKKYTIKMFYNLLKSLVQIEMRNDKTGKVIKRIGSKTNLKEISIKVIDKCLIVGIEIVKKVVEKVKKWLDGLGEVKKVNVDEYSDVLSGFRMDIEESNYYNILGS
jgi:hypothetical protein